MSNIDKRAVQAVADLKAGYTLGHADVAILNELARIALASLEAEAVCVIDQSNLDYLNSGSDADVWPASRTEMGDVLLYRSAPAAPVSVPGLLALDRLAGEMLNHAMNCERRVAVAYTHCAHRLAEEVRDLRAAMLQGTAGNSPVIPDGWVMVPLELTGAMTNAMTDAILDDLHNVDVWRSVLAAAPQQEVES
ncbi:hypothetical protein [Enterobacter kobei]|uniref:hypothetical protein n=1 Tax=Enterobacter kobei TaxID=208224 RepID=UPI000642F69C|nr:hypothetical protein [Enterobacter kobei]KLR28052.1 hypothetical protein ABR24_20745 [Enterobacter kobei]